MNNSKKKLKTSKYFSDIKDEENFVDFIDDLFERKIINGFIGLFKPEGEISRAELLKLIFSIKETNLSLDENTYFLDIKLDSWYKKYVNTALEKNIISKSSHFNPNLSISRVEGLKIILLYILGKFSLKYNQKFLDIKESDWFTNYIEYATRNNLFRNTSRSYFYPNKKLTRIEVLYIIYKLGI